MFFLNNLSILFEISISAAGNSLSASSMTVTFLSRAEKILAHSTPIAPEPAIKIFSGSSDKLRTSSEFRINFPSVSRPLICTGFAPVQMMMFLHSQMSVPVLILFLGQITAFEKQISTPWLCTSLVKDFCSF